MDEIRIIECPRDAMQGIKTFIPTEKKVQYIQHLLHVGFDTIDFGSFVSPKAIPQMADTSGVVHQLDLENSPAKLLAIIANVRGALDAAKHEKIKYLGYPFSISPTFQQLNTNKSPEQALENVKEIQHICERQGKTLVIYLSMAFGNPYGEAWNEKLVMKWAEIMTGMGIGVISLADTVGLAQPNQVAELVAAAICEFPEQEIGVHLHSTSENWHEKLDAALDNGCLRFDGAINGFGGCPMSGSELVGNINTGWMVHHFRKKGYLSQMNMQALEKAESLAHKIFM